MQILWKDLSCFIQSDFTFQVFKGTIKQAGHHWNNLNKQLMGVLNFCEISLSNRLHKRRSFSEATRIDWDADETRDSRHGEALIWGQRETSRSPELWAVRLWSGGKTFTKDEYLSAIHWHCCDVTLLIASHCTVVMLSRGCPWQGQNCIKCVIGIRLDQIKAQLPGLFIAPPNCR